MNIRQMISEKQSIQKEIDKLSSRQRELEAYLRSTVVAPFVDGMNCVEMQEIYISEDDGVPCLLVTLDRQPAALALPETFTAGVTAYGGKIKSRHQDSRHDYVYVTVPDAILKKRGKK